jgi:hypothetical protein
VVIFIRTEESKILSISSQRAPTGQVLQQTFFRGEVNGDLIIRAEKKGFVS